MNNFLLELYIKTRNSSKIKELNEEEFLKVYEESSENKKVALAHLREDYNLLFNSINSFTFSHNNKPLNKCLSDRDNMMFYLEVIDYYNSRVVSQKKILDEKLSKSNYYNFMLSESKLLIIKKINILIDLISSNSYYKELFYRNICSNSIGSKIDIETVLSSKEGAIYFAAQPEFLDFLSKQENLLFSLSINNSFFKNLPSQYRYLISYHIKPCFMANGKLERECRNNLKIILKDYFTYLSTEELEELLSIFDKQNMDNQKLSSLISLMIQDDNYFNYYNFLKNNYFDGDDELTIAFGRRYYGTNLFKSICEDVVPDIKEKLLFLSTVNRLNGISSLDDIVNISLDELKHVKNDKTIEIDVNMTSIRPRGQTRNILYKSDREIAVIDLDGDLSEYEVPEFGDHGATLRKVFADYNFDNNISELEMAKVISLDGNIVFIIENESVVVVVPSEISIRQRNTLIHFLSSPQQSMNIEIGYSSLLDGNLHVLNNGESMNIDDALLEIERMDVKHEKEIIG